MEFDMPEVTRCFGTFPPKYATYLISLFGMGSGGVGLAGIILYGLVENSIMAHFVNRDNIDDGVRKAVLLTIGLTSLLLTIGNIILFLGVTTASRGTVGTGIWIIFIMCMSLIIEVIAAPVSCFFIASTCLVKRISLTLMILGIIFITIFLEIWLYFMVVVFNYGNSI